MNLELFIFGIFNLISLIAGIALGALIDPLKYQKAQTEIARKIDEIKHPDKKRVGVFKPLSAEAKRRKGTILEETDTEMEKTFDSLANNE